MTHSIYNSDLETTIEVDETQSQNTSISITNQNNLELFHYLTPRDLNDLIGLLLHVQAKKRKEYKTKY